MTSSERKKSTVIIVDSDVTVRRAMRQSLFSTGFGNIVDVPDPSLALQKIEEKPFTHVIFEAKNTKMPAKDFLISVLELDDNIIALPSSYQPTIDDVFDLLILGARGYIVKPFTSAGLDESIVGASKGERLSDSILYAKSRNEALASFILSALNKLAIITKQARTFETAKRELPLKKATFRRAVDIGNTFAKGGPYALRETLVHLCLEQSENPTPKLKPKDRIPGRKKKKKALRKDPQPAQA